MKILVKDCVKVSEDDKIPVFHSPLRERLNGHTYKAVTYTYVCSLH